MLLEDLKGKIYKHLIYLVEDVRNCSRGIDCKKETDQILDAFAEELEKRAEAYEQATDKGHVPESIALMKLARELRDQQEKHICDRCGKPVGFDIECDCDQQEVKK